MTLDSPRARRRKKPKWDYRMTHLLSDDGQKAYSEAAVADLAAAHELPLEIGQSRLKDRLEGAALVYRIWRQNWDDLPRRGERKAALDEIRDLAAALQDRLSRLDDITGAIFWRPEAEISAEEAIPTAAKSRYGHTFYRDEETEGCTYLGARDLLESLAILQSYADEAVRNLPDDRGGRRHSEGLRMWMRNIATIWEDFSGKPFTLDYYQGEPVSEAARFTVAAFEAVNPGIDAKTIISEMKKHIRDERQRAAGKN